MDYLDPGMSSRNAEGKALIDGKQIGKGPPNTFVQSKIDGELEDHVRSGKAPSFEPWKPSKRRRRRKKKKTSALSDMGAGPILRRRRRRRSQRKKFRAPRSRRSRRRRRRR